MFAWFGFVGFVFPSGRVPVLRDLTFAGRDTELPAEVPGLSKGMSENGQMHDICVKT